MLPGDAPRLTAEMSLSPSNVCVSSSDLDDSEAHWKGSVTFMLATASRVIASLSKDQVGNLVKMTSALKKLEFPNILAVGIEGEGSARAPVNPCELSRVFSLADYRP